MFLIKAVLLNSCQGRGRFFLQTCTILLSLWCHFFLVHICFRPGRNLYFNEEKKWGPRIRFWVILRESCKIFKKLRKIKIMLPNLKQKARAQLWAGTMHTNRVSVSISKSSSVWWNWLVQTWHKYSQNVFAAVSFYKSTQVIG